MDDEQPRRIKRGRGFWRLPRSAIDFRVVKLYNLYERYMRGGCKMERVYSAAEARAGLAQILAEAGYAGREAVIQRNNKPIAVIIGYEQYQELVALRQQSREREARFAVYDEIRARNADVEPAQVEADVAQAVKAVRTRKRSKR